MKSTQQAAAVAVIAIGLIVVAISAVVLISQVREERAAQERLEKETAELRQEGEKLRIRPRFKFAIGSLQVSN